MTSVSRLCRAVSSAYAGCALYWWKNNGLIVNAKVFLANGVAQNLGRKGGSAIDADDTAWWVWSQSEEKEADRRVLRIVEDEVKHAFGMEEARPAEQACMAFCQMMVNNRCVWDVIGCPATFLESKTKVDIVAIQREPLVLQRNILAMVVCNDPD